MNAPVDVRPARYPRGPSLVATDIDSGTHALRTRLRIVEAEGNRVSVGDLDDHAMRAMREEPIEAVAAATALWDLLSDVLYTPQIAARLPRAPYQGVGSAQPWHVLGYRLLPAAVILAGEDTIEAALTGTLDPGAVPDPGVEAAFTVYESARNAAADYCHRTIQGARGKDAYLSILAAWDEFTHPDWEGVTSEGLWRTDLLWKPFTEAEMSDKEMARFIHTKSPLTYTRRYPSTPQNVEYPALRRQGRRADKARTARIMWVSFATSAINNTFNMLTEELHGGDNPMIAGPLFAPDPKPWTDTPTLRNVNTALTSGFRFPRPEDGTLPGLDQVFP
ncbi:MAG: hypothetical protein ACXWDM_12670, partial [Nocardioides sp.]